MGKSNNSYFSSFLPLKQQRIIAKILRCIPKKSLPFPSPFFFNFKQKTNSEIQQRKRVAFQKKASLFLLLSSLILNKKPTQKFSKGKELHFKKKPPFSFSFLL